MATRGKDPTQALQESVDRLASAFDKMADRLEHIESNGGGFGSSDGDAVQRHIRRYMPFYALAAIFALFMLVLPTKGGGDDNVTEAGGLTPSTSEGFDDSTTTDGTTASGDESTVKGTSAANNKSGVAQPPATSADGTNVAPPQFDPLKWDKTGKTRGGVDCVKGVRQLPWSRYAVPCYPAWSGNNGGATSRGVTPKEVIIVERVFPDTGNSQAVDALVQQAGFASQDEREATRRAFEKYFNKMFELWGRQVKVIKYESEYGNSTDEALSKGKEGACADADSILSKYKPFAVIGAGSTGVFGECGAERKMMVFDAGSYYPETWYRKYHPYIFAGVMECERIAHMNAEWIGKRLANRPAKWAKGLQAGLPRKIGLIVPDIDEYQFCVNIAEEDGKKYGTKVESRYDYQLDIQRFPDEAAQAVVQFNRDGITTIFLATDPLIPIFMTQSARGQEYFPEWILNSAGLTDVEQFARLWDQEEIQWSLFGMSQLGSNERILGPKGEGTYTYKKATGTDIPPGAQVEYYSTMRLFSIVQAAGPVLTPDAVASALWRMPPGGAPEYEVGYTSYATSPTGGAGRDHTAVDDMREIYWLCTQFAGESGGAGRCAEPKAFDGVGGYYVELNKGKRYRPGQFPSGEAPVFKEKP